jgi:hypothetical protein
MFDDTTSKRKFKVGQPVMFVDYPNDQNITFGIITEVRTATSNFSYNFPYLIEFSDDSNRDYFSESSVTLMVEDYNEYINGEENA